MPKTLIGISGWTFAPWRKTFYPKGLPQRLELQYASSSLGSIEINGTFYSLQRPTSFQSWYSQTPPDFIFSLKAPQFITHVLRLKEAKEPLCNFLASGILCLGEKLGPILWQFPPNVKLKDDRFEKFLKLLPSNSREAVTLAKKHGKKVEDRAWTKTTGTYPMRHAFEFRHPSFLHPDFLAMLREYNVAFVAAHDGAENSPYLETPTADFMYVRLHGDSKPKGYSKKELSEWVKKAKQWNRQKLDTFVYFNNKAKDLAPAGALLMQELLGFKPKRQAA